MRPRGLLYRGVARTGCHVGKKRCSMMSSVGKTVTGTRLLQNVWRVFWGKSTAYSTIALIRVFVSWFDPSLYFRSWRLAPFCACQVSCTSRNKQKLCRSEWVDRARQLSIPRHPSSYSACTTKLLIREPVAESAGLCLDQGSAVSVLSPPTPPFDRRLHTRYSR